MQNLERYFKPFRDNIVGIDTQFETPYGKQKLIYADWVASGRYYRPIELKLLNEIGPMIGNTHSEASETGTSMTHAYHLAQKIIKDHVHADQNDAIITAGFGMTGVVNKLQRIMGLKVPERSKLYCSTEEDDSVKYCTNLPEDERPVVFVTHMEHHSNHTSWIESIADVVIIEPGDDLLVNPENLQSALQKYKNRKMKIGAFSGCSNVTGIVPPYHTLAKIMHEHNGYCLVDFAASAPYLPINMHPDDPLERLDAVLFSPHKFLGGPGSSGVLIFNRELYHNEVPDHPGGGTVDWTNRWNDYKFVDDIEAREDGGTPGFLQAMKTALCIKLKEKMGTENIIAREKELLDIAFNEFDKIDKLKILADNARERIGVISFYVEGIHHNLIVKLLNDRFGIQVRGGCSCAGTYGHFLLGVDYQTSKEITEMINKGDLSKKPGWVRLSLHPTMKNDELYFITNAIKKVIAHIDEWKKDYVFSSKTGEFYHKNVPQKTELDFTHWYEI